MSSCRHCGSEVVWARNLDGSRWLRPLEPEYTVPELAAGELLITLAGGEWREAEPRFLRAHRLHVCSPVEPPRDVAPPVEPDDTPMTAVELRAASQQINEATERLHQQTADRRAARLRAEEMRRETGAYRNREAQAKRQRINCAKATPDRLLDVECPKCGAEVDEPCRSTKPWVSSIDGWLSTAHIERQRSADFTDDQPWPPRLGAPTQAGVVQMRRWLTANPSFFDMPDDNVRSEPQEQQ